MKRYIFLILCIIFTQITLIACQPVARRDGNIPASLSRISNSITGLKGGYTKNRDSQRVALELFVMSKCPYGIKAEKEILPVLDTFKDEIELKLFFIAQEADSFLKEHKHAMKDQGNGEGLQKNKSDKDSVPEISGTCSGESVYEGGKFVSLHGISEIEEGMRQVIIMTYYPEKFFDYLLFRSENYNTDNWEDAASRAWINIESVKEIFESEMAEALFRKNIKRAQELHINSSPTLLVNGKKYSGSMNYSKLGRLICPHISRNQECLSIPVCGEDKDCQITGKVGICEHPDTPQARCKFAHPMSIRLSIIDIPSNIGEETEKMVQFSKELFPKISIERLDFNSPQAQVLIKKYTINILPSFLFSQDVDKDLRYFYIKDDLTFKEDCYILNPHIFSVVYLQKREEKRGDLEIFIEGLNHKDYKIIQDIFDIPQLKEALSKINFIAKIENQKQPSPALLMISDSNQANTLILTSPTPKFSFKSKKGLPEIQENIRQLCILKKFPEKYWEYLECRSKQIINEKEQEWKECAHVHNLPIAIIDNCSISEEGAYLLSENIQYNEELNIQTHPEFLINNKWLIRSEHIDFIKKIFFRINGIGG